MDCRENNVQKLVLFNTLSYDSEGWTHSWATDSGADDIHARSPKVKDGTEVGEGSPGIGDGGSTDGDGGGSTGRARIGSIDVRVSSSDLVE